MDDKAFANVPSHLQGKMERCVLELKPKHGKKSAIAICYTSVVDGKDLDLAVKEFYMPKTKNGKTARQRRKEKKETEMRAKPEAEELAENPLADDEAELLEIDDDEAAELLEELEDELPEDESLEEEELEDEDEPEDAPEDEFDKDLDLAEIEYLLSEADIGILDKVYDIVQKAKLSSAARGSLPDSAFALVIERDGAKVRKYPIHDKSHVRNALARAAQMINRGGQAASDARAALGKIRAAAKRFGIGKPSKKKDNGFLVQKDKNGVWRWFGWVSNNFMDKEGEILSEEAHKEYVEFLDNNPQYAPKFWPWHTKQGQREHPADFWDFVNGFLLMGGKLTGKEAESLLKVGTKYKLGMSHTFVPIARKNNVITKYRMIEASELPLQNAANPWTNFDTKEVSMKEEKRKYLAEQFGDDFVKQIEDETAKEQEALQDAGVPQKDNESVDDVLQKVAGQDSTVKVLAQMIGTELDLPALVEFLKEAKEAVEIVPQLKKELESYKQNEDERLADMIAPSNEKMFEFLRRPSQDKDNIAEEDEAILKDVPKPGEHWLSDATNTQPVS